MLHHFLKNNHSLLLERCRTNAQKRRMNDAPMVDLACALPRLLTEITLRMRALHNPVAVNPPPEVLDRGETANTQTGIAGTETGKALFALGFHIEDVVLGYGDLCQAITELAAERDAPFHVSEFRMLNLCIDTAVANAVRGFSSDRDTAMWATAEADRKVQSGMLAHEMRNLMHTALLAFAALKAGSLSAASATGLLAEQTLLRLGKLTDQLLLEVVQTNEPPRDAQTFALAPLLTEVEHAAKLASHVRSITFSSSLVDPLIMIHGDRERLYEAITNLIQNAFKFTQEKTGVRLLVNVRDDVSIEVHDHCGGLPFQDEGSLFDPFVQVGEDKTGLGLGLAIVKRNVEGMLGTVDVRNVPGRGCVFTIRLPIAQK